MRPSSTKAAVRRTQGYFQLCAGTRRSQGRAAGGVPRWVRRRAAAVGRRRAAVSARVAGGTAWRKGSRVIDGMGMFRRVDVLKGGVN